MEAVTSEEDMEEVAAEATEDGAEALWTRNRLLIEDISKLPKSVSHLNK